MSARGISSDVPWYERARSRLKQLGITQTDLAKSLDAPVSRINAYLIGAREPSFEQFKLIVSALGVTSDWLLFGGSVPPAVPHPKKDRLSEMLERATPGTRRDVEGFLKMQASKGKVRG